MVHKRCRNCFGHFWYPPPPCRNFDPDLPNVYLQISCNIEISDLPPTLKYSDVFYGWPLTIIFLRQTGSEGYSRSCPKRSRRRHQCYYCQGWKRQYSDQSQVHSSTFGRRGWQSWSCWMPSWAWSQCPYQVFGFHYYIYTVNHQWCSQVKTP